MGSDLAGSPQTGIRVQLCGDAPLANFGAVASPGRQLLFDLNDFDETLPGPWGQLPRGDRGLCRVLCPSE
jgi:uncharacterized protein (DUF2252 family)